MKNGNNNENLFLEGEIATSAFSKNAPKSKSLEPTAYNEINTSSSCSSSSSSATTSAASKNKKSTSSNKPNDLSGIVTDNSSSSSSSFLFTYDKPTTTASRLNKEDNKINVDSAVQTDDLIDVKTTAPSHKMFLRSLHESSITGLFNTAVSDSTR